MAFEESSLVKILVFVGVAVLCGGLVIFTVNPFRCDSDHPERRHLVAKYVSVKEIRGATFHKHSNFHVPDGIELMKASVGQSLDSFAWPKPSLRFRSSRIHEMKHNRNQEEPSDLVLVPPTATPPSDEQISMNRR